MTQKSQIILDNSFLVKKRMVRLWVVMKNFGLLDNLSWHIWKIC